MSIIHNIFLFILPYIAKLFPHNWTKDRWKYPQLWWCMPRRWVETDELWPNGHRKLRRSRPRLVIERICGFLTGHEISKTEYGYAGNDNKVDRQCRWCDKSFQIPKIENHISGIFQNLTDLMDNQTHSSDGRVSR